MAPHLSGPGAADGGQFIRAEHLNVIDKGLLLIGGGGVCIDRATHFSWNENKQRRKLNDDEY
jgi:hypothetical protein